MTSTHKRIIPNPDTTFLEGPKSRGYELAFLFSVMMDFIRGFRVLHFAGPCVTVFGSARFKQDHPDYQKAMAMGRKISELGFTVMTGGGPGIMEAANRGAKQNGGRSIGVNIALPFEQEPNPYMDRWVTMKYFFTRKVLLLKYSYAFVVMPGGWGTMDELFETLTLIQTKTIHDFPIVLLGREYFQPLFDYFQLMYEKGTISREDLSLILLTDDTDEALHHIRDNVMEDFAVHIKRKPRWWFLEKS